MKTIYKLQDGSEHNSVERALKHLNEDLDKRIIKHITGKSTEEMLKAIREDLPELSYRLSYIEDVEKGNRNV